MSPTAFRPATLVLLLVPALTLAGCATAPAPKAGPAPGDRISGHWEGTWQSAHGHHGRLLGDFSRIDAGHEKAHFTAYWGGLHGSYDILLEAYRTGRASHFAGSKDLGVLYGGLYHYTATADGRQFHADYTAKADHGTFSLTRQTAPAPHAP